jgi:hypothetical protein
MSENEITQDLLREHFEYRDGHLFWIKPATSRVKVGQQFGACISSGYRHGRLKGKYYYEHRLVWLYHYGHLPEDYIDHINRIKDDNRIENLREANRHQNQWNTGSCGGRSKYKGVCYRKDKNKWCARYRNHGQRFHVGYYATELEAAIAYDKAVEHLHGKYQVKNV